MADDRANIQFSLTSSQRNAFKAECAQQGVSMATYLRACVDLMVEAPHQVLDLELRGILLYGGSDE